MSLVLVQFAEDLYYGSLDGLFVTTADKLNKVLEEEPEVYMGECAGKHSEVHVTLNKDNLIVITEDQTFIQQAVLVFTKDAANVGHEIDLLGTNPFGSLEDEDFFNEDNEYDPDLEDGEE